MTRDVKAFFFFFLYFIIVFFNISILEFDVCLLHFFF